MVGIHVNVAFLGFFHLESLIILDKFECMDTLYFRTKEVVLN